MWLTAVVWVHSLKKNVLFQSRILVVKEHLFLCSYEHLVVKVLWENKMYAKIMRI